jgi:MtN3 and saliva related transmembrane protein
MLSDSESANQHVGNTIGILGGILVTASLIPQLVKILVKKSSGDVSAITFCMFALGEALWSYYAGNRQDWILLAFRIISGLLAIAILVAVVIYTKRKA